jgi:RNA polymerase sigma-70 factor (ECF subfamily)
VRRSRGRRGRIGARFVAIGRGNKEARRGVYSERDRPESVDRDRFEAEALPHVKRLYGTAYRMTGNAADAEDLVQETLLRAFRGFDRFRPGSNIRAWLYTILHHVRTDAFRRAGRRVQTEELAGDGPSVPPPQEGLVWGGETVERALARVPEVFREAVVLRDVEELSYAEIATALDVPQGTVMSRISRGRALLRRALGEGRS